MATVTVSFDGTRLSNSDTTTNYSIEGIGSFAAETDFYYQGSASVSGLVKTAEVGFYYTDGATANYSTGNYVWIAKVIQTNKDAIDGNGLQLKIGSANSAAYLYSIFSATTYPVVGGWQIVCINPNITQWRSSTIGSPDLTAVDTYGIRSDAAFTAKAPNLGMDAIDYVVSGKGLTLTRGDSTDANGTFTDLVTSDEGTQANRWGIVQTRGGILYVNGKITIGNSSVNTEFTDSNKVLVFPDHRVSNNFCGVDFNCSNTGSVYTITSTVFNGRGALYTNDDTRPFYTVTGEAGTLTLDQCTFNVFGQMNLTSNCVLSGTSLIGGRQLVQSSANLDGCVVTGATTSNGVAFIIGNNLSRIRDCDFTFSTTGGHAIELTTTGTFNCVGNQFTGYGANGTGNSAIYNNSGGAVTIYVENADPPTVRNGTGATTNVQLTVSTTFTGIQTESEVRVYSQDSVTGKARYLLAGVESSNGQVQDATVYAGGSGYTNNDVLTVSGGTGTPATLTVQTNGSGVVTSVAVTTGGEYSVNPTNPVSVTGGTGTSAQFDLDISGSFTYSYSYSAGTKVWVIFFHSLYKDQRILYTLQPTSGSIPIQQVSDRVYTP